MIAAAFFMSAPFPGLFRYIYALFLCIRPQFSEQQHRRQIQDVYKRQLIVLLALLVLAGGKQGIFTILGLTVNISLFCVLLMLYGTGPNVLALSIVLVILFSCIVLILINGVNRRTWISLCATLGAVAFVGLLSAAVIWLGPEISYEFMEYLPEPYTRSDANLLFLSEILIGGLGVIMDIAVTITACSAELIRKDPYISRKALLQSCRQVRCV